MAEKFIAKATENAHGQFRRKAEAAGESTQQFASEHEHDSGKTGKQARLAEVLMHMHGRHHEEHRQMTERHSNEMRQMHMRHERELNEGGHGE